MTLGHVGSQVYCDAPGATADIEDLHVWPEMALDVLCRVGNSAPSVGAQNGRSEARSVVRMLVCVVGHHEFVSWVAVQMLRGGWDRLCGSYTLCPAAV